MKLNYEQADDYLFFFFFFSFYISQYSDLDLFVSVEEEASRSNNENMKPCRLYFSPWTSPETWIDFVSVEI